MTLSEMRVGVHPGNGIVAHLDGAIVVIPEAVPAEFADQLLATAMSACSTYGPAPGRQLIRKLAGLVTSLEPDDVATFAAVSSAADGLAVMLCGWMEMQLSKPGGNVEVLSGRDVATWADRVIREPFDRLVLLPVGASEPPGDPRTDLRAGIVLGSGVTVAPARAPLGEGAPDKAQPSAPPDAEPGKGLERKPIESSAEPRNEEPPVVRPPGFLAPEPESAPPHRDPTASGFISVVVSEPLPSEELQPLPVATGASADRLSSDASEQDQAVVQGILCARAHFNDPEARFCAVCGIGMVQQTHNLTSGPRPSLGVLVLDDGASFVVDNGYVIGRAPEASELVLNGQARPLTISDPERRVSRVHALVFLDNWDVQIEDAGSASGTRILRPGSSEWQLLDAGERTIIATGTRIGICDRELIFDSHVKAL